MTAPRAPSPDLAGHGSSPEARDLDCPEANPVTMTASYTTPWDIIRGAAAPARDGM